MSNPIPQSVIDGQLAVILDLQELVRQEVQENSATAESVADATEALQTAIGGLMGLTNDPMAPLMEAVEGLVEAAVEARFEEEEEVEANA